MLPEISRRCLVCGASPRAGARYCPQCGSNLTERGRGGPETEEETNEAANEAAGEAGAGDATTDEPPRVAEVARAFEAWRGGAAHDEPLDVRDVATNEPPREAEAGEPPPPLRDVTVEPEAGGASMKEPLAGWSSSPLSSSSPPPPSPPLFSSSPPPPSPQPSPVAGEVEEKDVDGARPSSSSKVGGAVGATRRRAASVVKESIAPRVERVRDRSIVMLEDAPPDSGLRFVVIAAALFALFVLMLVLNAVIK